MTKVGVIGLGNLGMVLAVAMEQKGHTVCGYDINPDRMQHKLWTREANADGKGSYAETAEKSTIVFHDTLAKVVQDSDLLFVCVQTPNLEYYSGEHRLHGKERKDYDYSWLEKAITDINAAVTKDIVVNIVCTVLPGTIRNRIFPLCTSPKLYLSYNPYFVAMGTAVRDFYHPEFILLGKISYLTQTVMIDFYKTITDAEVYTCTLEEAELIKMYYNTFISMKVMYANTIMEICDKTPNTDCDVVTRAVQKATRRLCSGSYLHGGMPDGGPCHAKDLAAMWFLGKTLNLHFDLFDAVMLSAEQQLEFIADLIVDYHQRYPDLPMIQLGKSFKADTNLTTGSRALLLKRMLEEEHKLDFQCMDPLMDEKDLILKPGLYWLAVDHQLFHELTFPEGSVVIDPFRHIKPQKGVMIHSVGKHLKSS